MGRHDGHRRILLPGETDFPAFRRQARALIDAGIPPERVEWRVAGTDEDDLFFAADRAGPPVPDDRNDDTDEDDDGAPPVVGGGAGAGAGLKVPASFLPLCRSVLLHSDPDRFGLLYRLLWRLVHEPALRHDPLDADLIRAEHLAKAVRRDQHKMTAFVRFRTVAPEFPGAPALQVAWFEPEHHIVEATAPFFVRRFTPMHWAILSPRRSVRWFPATADGTPGRLETAPGARREDAPPADAGEALWLTYYASIFNPARLKLAMMQKEMPRKYWHNLPEARLIGSLSAQAMARSGTMIDQAPTVPARRIRPMAGTPSSPSSLLPADEAGHPAVMPIHSLAQLKISTDRCRECPIGHAATQSVAGEGPVGAALMVVGEQPGDHEDLRGRPFVGPAGRLFDRAMAELGWQRERLYLTNAVKHFKFELRGKRRIHKTPGQREAAACGHWLEDEFRLVGPRAILALGGTAARAVLGRPVAVMTERGQWFDGPGGLPVLVALHPSALLRADPDGAEQDFADWLQNLSLASVYATI